MIHCKDEKPISLCDEISSFVGAHQVLEDDGSVSMVVELKNSIFQMPNILMSFRKKCSLIRLKTKVENIKRQNHYGEFDPFTSWFLHCLTHKEISRQHSSIL